MKKLFLKKITLMGSFPYTTTQTEPSLGITIMSSRCDVTPAGGGGGRAKAGAGVRVSLGAQNLRKFSGSDARRGVREDTAAEDPGPLGTRVGPRSRQAAG